MSTRVNRQGHRSESVEIPRCPFHLDAAPGPRNRLDKRLLVRGVGATTIPRNRSGSRS